MSTTGRVKPRAFQPKVGQSSISAFCIMDLDESVIWYIGDVHVGAPIQKQVLARAELSKADLAGIGLAFTPDDKPIRHGHIGDFPVAKDEWKSVAQELRAIASLRLRGPEARPL